MKLSPLQIKFCELYVQTGNAGKAYLEAGYKVKSPELATQSASRMLSTNDNVIAYIQELKSSLAKKHQVTTERLIQKAAEIAFAGMDDLVEIDEHTLQPKLKRGASLDSLDSISASESISADSVSRGFSIKKADRLKALDMLAKMIGAYDRDPADNQRNIADSAARILDALRAVRKK
jgi:phage terminase small subunit